MSDVKFYADPTNSVGYLSRIAFRAFSRALEVRTSVHGVSAGQWRFLRVLWQEDGLTQRELSRRVGMREPTTVIALKSLERSGFVTRRKSEEDRRKVHVFLTPQAKALHPVLMPMVAEVNAGFQQLAHRECRHGHAVLLFRLSLRGRRSRNGNTGASAGMSPRRPQTRVRSGAFLVVRRPKCKWQ